LLTVAFEVRPSLHVEEPDVVISELLISDADVEVVNELGYLIAGTQIPLLPRPQ
jgi:hypothetical protein